MLTVFIHFNKLRAFRFFITVRARSAMWAFENYTDVMIIFTIWLSRSHIYWHFLFSAQNSFFFLFSLKLFHLFYHERDHLQYFHYLFICVVRITTKFAMKQIENQSKWKSNAHVWILMRYALYFLFWTCYMRLLNSNGSEIAFFSFLI